MKAAACLVIAPLDVLLRPQLDEVIDVAWRRLDALADELRFRAVALKLAAFC